LLGNPDHPMQSNPENAFSSSSTQVLLRFIVRLAVVAAIASIAQVGFRQAIPGLLFIAALFCGMWGVIFREKLFAPILTHWDEAAFCVALGKLAAVAG